MVAGRLDWEVETSQSSTSTAQGSCAVCNLNNCARQHWVISIPASYMHHVHQQALAIKMLLISPWTSPILVQAPLCLLHCLCSLRQAGLPKPWIQSCPSPAHTPAVAPHYPRDRAGP